MLTPLRFRPLFRHYLWGGRRLATLGKTLGDEPHYAESWEVVDRRDDQSVVQFGPLAGRTLHELVAGHGQELLGRHAPADSFPLLFKFLDAQARLSMQVHPNDQRAALLAPPDRGKTEAWVIVAADPGSYLYAGLKRGFDREALRREVVRGTCELCVQRIEPRVGDCFFLPAGVVHALGPGIMLAEIQQASDTTYRLFDWNRVGPDSQPRPLHVEQALEAIDYSYGPVRAQQPQAIETIVGRCERLVACDKFVIDRLTFDVPRECGGDERCHLIAVLEGSVAIAGDPAGVPLARGEVALLPSCCGAVSVTPLEPTMLLDVYLP